MALIPENGQADRIRFLRRFGAAVASDGRAFVDEGHTRRLVDGLCNRALFAARNGEGPRGADMRVRLYALFLRFLRRHMRLAACDDAPGETTARRAEADERDGAGATARAVRGLPLELREALLLVTLERLSHVEAAQALDIPLSTLIGRLARARAALAAGLCGSDATPLAAAPRRGRANLRLVK